MIYYIYILKSINSGKYYVGFTGNLEQRIRSHNLGLQRWTRNKGPWELVYAEEFPDKKSAIMREKALKRKKSRIAIENIINQKKDKPGTVSQMKSG